MEIETCVQKIRQAPLKQLKDSSWLENYFLLELGLNNEELQEFPKHLHPYCGFGLKSWQYPNQFSKYLVWLSQQDIKSYLEIGCRHGGTFIITVEYLERFSEIQLAVAVDPFHSVLMQKYALSKKNVKYLNISSQDLAFKDLANAHKFDLVLIDGDHTASGVKYDYNVVKDSAKFLVFHDIVNTVCPGVVNLWVNLKNKYSKNVEFIEQYDSVPYKYLGIGVIDTREYKYISVEIASVYETTHQPFWSVMIPTYNCTNYLVETLKSVLEQDPGAEEMQIEVVDDCSSKDNPEEVVKELGKGRVSFFRHPQNRGAIHTFNTCIQRAKGQWVHILHSDDLVVPGFYSRLRESVEQQPEVGAAFCRSILINENGQWQSLSSLQRQTPGILSNWVERIAVSQQIETPTIVVRRSVYEKLGGFHLELFHAADWEMWKRIAVHYPVWYEPQPLACYRTHAASDTSRLMRTGANVANIRRAIEISESYLPQEITHKISDRVRDNYAFAAINIARQMLALGDMDAAIAQVWESLLCSNSSAVIQSLVSLIASIDVELFLVVLSKYVEEKQENLSSKYKLDILHKALQEKPIKLEQSLPTILVDAVFFQLYETGIARVWKSLLEEWVDSGFAQHIIVLDRANTAPKIPGIRYRTLPPYNYNNTDADREMLQQVCDEEGANLFISSYYTTPITTTSVFMAYDMIPEVMGWDLSDSMWREKHYHIQHAAAYIAISENTARDLVRFFPDIPSESITLAYCGVKNAFSPAKPEEVNAFKTKYGIFKPYFILVGAGGSYKNSILFFQAFSQLASSYGFDIVCTGSGGVLAPEWRAYTSGSAVHMLQLSDEELVTAYSGAVALVYPSKYEGFGMPVVEAMACGCPVITCPNASIPEVAGEAAIYVNDNDVEGLVNALCDVQKSGVRNSLIIAGLEQAKQFSWSKMAKTVSSALIDTTLLPLKLKQINLIVFPDWSQPEEVLGLELEEVIRTLATHPDSQYITLIVETSNSIEQYAELLLSSVSMNLLMQEDLDVSEELEISFVGQFSEMQWEALRPQVKARILLEHENKQAVAQSRVETLTSFKVEKFTDIQNTQFFFELSNKFFQEGRWQEAIAQYQHLLSIQVGEPDVYWRLSECYRQSNLIDEASRILQEGIKLYPTDGNLHFSLIMDLRHSGQNQKALSSAITASNALPDDYTFKLLKHLIVPSIYDNQEEINFYRQRFTQGLQDLIQETSLKTAEEKQNALAGIGRLTNFYISYQAQNDIGLQREYGKLVHEIMAANYPQWVAPLSMPSLKPGNKIRIGYASNYLHSYSGTLWLTGWLRHCDRDSFEIYCYYTGNSPDAITKQFQDDSDVFYHIPHNLEAACQQIVADQLHILVYPEIGMDAQTMQMASLRLAPVQCVAWGHPVTTGLPTIDYFLSSQLMEPENAQEHYSEKLIRLPNIGVSYPKPYIPPVIKARSDYKLRDDAVVYLCCQAPFKYLPQYDFIFAEIARRVPQTQFVFLRGGLLQERLNRAFATVGLKSEEYCVFLTIPERLDYLMINLLSDVFLDTFTWSGGNTTLEAIACNLPVVTCPGEFMRGRHSDSFLKMLGVTDTIAQNEAEYIEIAVKLGLDPAWRRDITKCISQSHDNLYEDKACVAGLEAFYKAIWFS